MIISLILNFLIQIFTDTWVKDHGNEDLKLPGFQDLSSKQMFWISFAQIYCSKWTDDGIFKLIASVRSMISYEHSYELM